MGTDAEAISGHERHRTSAMAHDETRRQFGRGRGFTDPSRPYQRHDAGLIEKAIFVRQHLQPRYELFAQPSAGSVMAAFLGQ